MRLSWGGLINLIKICLRTCDMTLRSYFGNQNSTLGFVVPLAMFDSVFEGLRRQTKMNTIEEIQLREIE